MEQENKTTKKVAIAPNVFVKASDMSQNQFKNLSRVKALLKKTISKKGYKQCSLEIEIDKTFLSISVQISDARYNFLRLKLERDIFDSNKREIFEYPFLVPYRFIKGMNSNGEYKSIELILGQFMSETYFFNDFNELGTLEILEEKKILDIDWVVRPDKVDVTATVNSKWEE